MAIFICIFFLLMAIYGLLMEYYHGAWNRMPEYRENDTMVKMPVITPAPAATAMIGENDTMVKVTIVIAVRNEEKNIARLLGSLGQQDYPAHLLEVVFVDDHSADGTAEALRAAIADHPNIRLISLPEDGSGKKKAIEHGVQVAAGELIVTTDADCLFPVGWVSTLAGFYALTGAKCIAAPVRMLPGRSLRGLFQSLDFLALQGITGAAVFNKLHMMCNGANFAYTRSCFLEVNGFAGIDHIPSGDDMLLMHKIFLRYPDGVRYLKSRDAIVTTFPEPTWKDLLQQRIRWASKTVHYQDKNIFYILLLTYLLNLCFVVLAVICCMDAYWLFMLLLFLPAKIVIEFPFLNSIAAFFSQRRLMFWFALLQPVHILYIILAGWLGSFGSYTWKSRTVKNTTAKK